VNKPVNKRSPVGSMMPGYPTPLATAEVVLFVRPWLLFPTVEQLIPYLSAGTILTDVGRLKHQCG